MCSIDELGPIEIAPGGQALGCTIGVVFADPDDYITAAAITGSTNYPGKLTVTNFHLSGMDAEIGGLQFPAGDAVVFDLAADPAAVPGDYEVYFTPTLGIAGVKPSRKAVKIVAKHRAT